MHPSLEPGLERGVPWGRDLYTFVTSAAGHMMRTLQKPRKNRPSKRQVNHRRFLHNMIQRKLADIEAANHKLAPALDNNEKEKNMLALPSRKPDILDKSDVPSVDVDLQDQDHYSHHAEVDDMAKSRTGSQETEIREKQQKETGHLWKRHPKSQNTTCSARQSNQSKGRQRTETLDHKLEDVTSVSFQNGEDGHHRSKPNQPVSAHFFEEDSPTLPQDTSFFTFGQNVDVSSSVSPELSPSSLDSCDFSMQIFKDILTQKNMADISEGQWTDFMDLFSAGSRDLEVCMDVEAYLESICVYQGDGGQGGRDEGVAFSDQSDGCRRVCSDRSGVKDLQTETGDYRYEYGYFCSEDQGLAIRQNKDIPETQFNDFQPSQDTYIIHNQLPTSTNYNYIPSELQMCQHSNQDTSCAPINCENFTPFEGVAQSFSVPPHNPEDRPIPTPPHEDDWLFTDILKSPECQENMPPLKSDAWIMSAVDGEGEGDRSVTHLVHLISREQE
ncbi:uncharacterized protein LOC122881926 [Xyrichtys novacula]|uniref:Uncharacterized protein LOC122881926 n=1 Tax=Xyrichtys novacula TaxID=13765 RepID=A0AAV1FQ19_XYRNO|nr:uncharacterized protein LOC122881926 [Xyrichtys novacula]